MHCSDITSDGHRQASRISNTETELKLKRSFVEPGPQLLPGCRFKESRGKKNKLLKISLHRRILPVAALVKGLVF